MNFLVCPACRNPLQPGPSAVLSLS
ncbi:Trm112 family protein [Bradyrhizobium sp. Arg314]